MSKQVCSFCNQLESRTQPMLDGPGMSTRICGRCVVFAKQLLDDEPLQEKHGDCSFCGRAHAPSRRLVFGPGVNICGACVTFAGRRLDGGDVGKASASRSLWRGLSARIRSLMPGRRAERTISAGI